jgi:tripartite-type tricarboxylate transporter receptor subunit TctC
VAPKDGTEIGVINQNVALGQLVGAQGVNYDARQFTWIGRATSNVEIFYAWHTAPIKTIAEAKTRQIIAGGTGPTSSSETMPRIMNQLLGTKFTTVAGYVDGGAVSLALERGEVEAYVTPWAVLKSSKSDWLRDKKITILVQFTLERHPDLPDVPTSLDLAENAEDRQIFALFASGSAIGRSVMAPPSLPPTVTAAYRAAFVATMKDPALVAEAKKANLELDWASGEQLQKTVESVFAVSPSVVAKAADLNK